VGRRPIGSMVMPCQGPVGGSVLVIGSGTWNSPTTWHPWHDLQTLRPPDLCPLARPHHNDALVSFMGVRRKTFPLRTSGITFLESRKTSLPHTHTHSSSLTHKHTGVLQRDQSLLRTCCRCLVIFGSLSETNSTCLDVRKTGMRSRAVIVKKSIATLLVSGSNLIESWYRICNICLSRPIDQFAVVSFYLQNLHTDDMVCHDFWLYHSMDSSKMNTDCSLPILKLSQHCTQAMWSCVSCDASVATPFEIRKGVGLSHGILHLLKQLFLRLSPNKRLILPQISSTQSLISPSAFGTTTKGDTHFVGLFDTYP